MLDAFSLAANLFLESVDFVSNEGTDDCETAPLVLFNF